MSAPPLHLSSQTALAAVPQAAREVAARLLLGEISVPVAAAGLLVALEQPAEVRAAAAALAEALPSSPQVAELAGLIAGPGIWEAMAPLLLEHPEEGRMSPEQGLADCRAFFDRAVATNEEASVALYSLGDPAVLAAATAEVVDALLAWDLLFPGCAVLEIGCGIGRFQAALAPLVGEAHGLDISPGMIAAARRRCAGLPNVHLELGSGRDLALYPDERFDLVLAVDSFPYLHAAGPEIVETHVREAARVLRPGGALAVLNWSYRGDLDEDAEEFGQLCAAAGFDVTAAGDLPFEIWDGAAFRAIKAV